MFHHRCERYLFPKDNVAHDRWAYPRSATAPAQSVVKDYLEPSLERIFHPSSFGYRPGKSAHEALQQCQKNCIQYTWVLEVDIKGFFDNLNHDIMLQLLRQHTQENWILLYAERWLKAGIEQQDGSIAAREKGTPQGSVISPLLGAPRI